MWKLVALLVLMSLVVSVAACAPAAPQVAPSSPPPSGGAARVGGESKAQAPAAAPRATDAGQSAAPGSQVASWDRMIIRTATLSIVVKDVENSLNAVRDIATSAGGFVAQSNSRFEGERMVANVVIQVPSAAYENSIQQIRRLAIKVETENGTTQDVTEEFTDLESQSRNLRATEAALLRILDRAERVEDILAVQRELTSIRGQIEKIQGRMNFLSRRTEMSTITISLVPEAFAGRGKSGWKPLETAAQAWDASLLVMQRLADVVIVLVVFLWWLIPIVALFIFAWRAYRARRRPRTAP
ncbi:MAG: DUF4349 domain-containing protein [Chloroflexi bacterium]|nr:DUF4349 domain-containing protein [Chloroflexota bacterium]